MNGFQEDVKQAIQVLGEGGVILYPTDTIWGLGCDVSNDQAVDRIYKIKERNDSKSMLVLVDSEAMIERYVEEVPEVAWQLIEVSHSPLTIVYPGAKNVSSKLIAEDGSLAIRLTSEAFTKQLIGRFRRPIVSTSANISGTSAPQNFDEIAPGIIRSVDYVVGYRQGDLTKSEASSIIKIGLGGEIQVIRK